MDGQHGQRRSVGADGDRPGGLGNRNRPVHPSPGHVEHVDAIGPNPVGGGARGIEDHGPVPALESLDELEVAVEERHAPVDQEPRPGGVDGRGEWDPRDAAGGSGVSGRDDLGAHGTGGDVVEGHAVAAVGEEHRIHDRSPLASTDAGTCVYPSNVTAPVARFTFSSRPS